MNLEDLHPAFTDSIVALSAGLEQRKATLDLNKQALLDLVTDAQLLGDPLESGTLQQNIHHGIVYGTGGPHGVNSKGDYPIVNLGRTEGVYVHYCLPININRDVHMFWLRIRGYNYGGSTYVDETLAGYCYADDRILHTVAVKGRFSPTVYADASGNVVLRLYFPLIYYTTLTMDTMRVGIRNRSRLFTRADIRTVLSLSSVLNFG